MKNRRLGSILGLAAAGVLLSSWGCGSTLPRRDPTGEAFPRVTATNLDGDPVTLPSGEAQLLLVGYLQEAQFDLDRWLLGLLQAGAPVPIYEVPTIPSRIASVFEEGIDGGMRAGIPPEEWRGVVTLYGQDAEPVAELTGTENGRNGRVLLLDAGGRIVWFHDEGYSAATLLDLLEAARSLSAPE